MSTYDRQATKQMFDRDGFTVIPGFSAADEVATLHEQIARYVKDVMPGLPATSVFFEKEDQPATLKQLEHMNTNDAYFKQYMEDERFIELGELLLDGPIVPQNQQWFNKPPAQSSATPAHQDGFYFCLVPNEAVNMWLALDEIDQDNGCIRYVAGSHRRGLRPHGQSGVLGFSQGMTDWSDEDDAKEVAVTVGPGDLTVQHSLTIHRAEANRSARPRRALGGVYYSTRAKVDQRAQDEYLRNLGMRMEEKVS